MVSTTEESKQLTVSRKPSSIAGLTLMLLGVTGITLSGLLPLNIELLLGMSMLSGGIMWSFFTYSHSSSISSWLKSLILISSGVLILTPPTSSASAITFLTVIYLFVDAIGCFGLAYEQRSIPNSIWLSFDGLLSLMMFALVLVAITQIGGALIQPAFDDAYICLSLLFDGIALVLISIPGGPD